jgi:hypothetical protein
MTNNNRKPVQFYFSLPRAIAMLFGGDAQRSESNGAEAVTVGFWIYAIHYLFLVTKLTPLLPTRLLMPFLLVLAAFAVWLAWIPLIYFDALIIRLLRFFGLFQHLPARRAHMILLGVITTGMAGSVLVAHPWLWQLSLVWLLTVVLNMIAAMVLTFSDAARGFDDQ